MLYLKHHHEEGVTLYALEEPIFVRRQGNGIIVRVDSPALAWGVVSPDGSEIWQLAGRTSLGEGYAVAEPVTGEEYETWLVLQEQAPDPEDTDPVIPEGTDPATVLTRAELTEKVKELDEALNLLLSGVTEDET